MIQENERDKSRPLHCYLPSIISFLLSYKSILFFFFKANLTKFAFQLFNGIGDFITLKDVLDPKELPNWDKMTKDEILAKVGIKIKWKSILLVGYFVCFVNFGGHNFLWFACWINFFNHLWTFREITDSDGNHQLRAVNPHLVFGYWELGKGDRWHQNFYDVINLWWCHMTSFV